MYPGQKSAWFNAPASIYAAREAPRKALPYNFVEEDKEGKNLSMSLNPILAARVAELEQMLLQSEQELERSRELRSSYQRDIESQAKLFEEQNRSYELKFKQYQELMKKLEEENLLLGKQNAEYRDKIKTLISKLDSVQEKLQETLEDFKKKITEKDDTIDELKEQLNEIKFLATWGDILRDLKHLVFMELKKQKDCSHYKSWGEFAQDEFSECRAWKKNKKLARTLHAGLLTALGALDLSEEEWIQLHHLNADRTQNFHQGIDLTKEEVDNLLKKISDRKSVV